MKYGFLFFLLFLIFPAPSQAAVQAGFPSQPLWLSKENVTANETVTIFTVLYNESNGAVGGNLVFTVDGQRIASQTFSLDAGKSSIQSAQWKATAGNHTISALIESASDTDLDQVITLSNEKAGSISLAVAEPPPPSPVIQAVSTVSNIAGSIASTSLPLITSAVESVYGATEAFRTNAVAYFKEKAADDSPPNAASEEPRGNVLSAETKSASGGTPNVSGFASTSSATATSFSQLSQVAASAALFFFDSRPLFYLALILLALGTLYWLARKVRRPQS